MNARQLLDKILPLLHFIKDDKEKLAKLLSFMEEEFTEAEVELDDYDYKEKLPEKYREIVRKIAYALSAKLVCFFNPDTLELEDVPPNLLDEMIFDEDDEDETGETLNEDDSFFMKHLKWDKCIEIEPLESNESFKIMASFVNQLKSGRETEKLVQALNGHKPFANFNHQIHNSKYREDWFAFRLRALEKHVIENYFYEFLNE